MSGLQLRDVALRVDDRLLLDAVGFHAQPGEVVAILGANGTGKTTLLRTIAGLAPPARGEITLDGKPLTRLTPRERARHVALVTGDDALLEGLTVREAVAAGRYAHHPWWDWHSSAHDEDAVDAALGAVELQSYGGRAMATLSSGERGRAWIALALAQDTPVILLDEPTSHLDVRFAIDVLQLLRAVAATGRVIVIALHSLEEAADYADRVVLLGEGTALASGRPREVLDAATLARAYGVRLDVVHAGDAILFRRKYET